jgi:hypothetical protein
VEIDLGPQPLEAEPLQTQRAEERGHGEYERSMVALRLRSGRRPKGERGGYAYGSPALGQRAEAGQLVVDEVEARALARIRELHAERHSLRSMAAILTEEGYRPKRSDRWHPQSLARVIARLRREARVARNPIGDAAAIAGKLPT